MSVLKQVLPKIQRFLGNGFGVSYANTEFSKIEQNGDVLASLKTPHGASSGFLTNFIDGISSVSLAAATHEDMKFGVSVSLDVNISSTSMVSDTVFLSSSVINVDDKLATLDCKVYADEGMTKLIAQGTHVKFLV